MNKDFILEGWDLKKVPSPSFVLHLEMLEENLKTIDTPLLWRAPPLDMRRESREFFPEEAGKVSLLSSYEIETGLLWMWAGLSCVLSSGAGYVGELLKLQ